MSSSERREERAHDVVKEFKKIMDMLDEEDAKFDDRRREILKAIGNKTASISFAIVEIAVDSLSKAIDNPYFVLIDRVSDMINSYYYVISSPRVRGTPLETKMQENIIKQFRRAVHYNGKYERHNETQERKEFRRAALSTGGDAKKIVSQAMNREIQKEIAKEEGELDEDAEEEDDNGNNSGSSDRPV